MVEVRDSLVTLNAFCVYGLAENASLLLNNTILHGDKVPPHPHAPPSSQGR